MIAVSILLIFALLQRLLTAAICDICHNDECEEETEGQICFVILDDSIEQADVNPDIGDNRPASGDKKYTDILHFLDAFGRVAIEQLLLLACVVVLIHRVDRDTRNEQEVEGSGAHDCGRAQLTRLVTERLHSLDDVEENFWGG